MTHMSAPTDSPENCFQVQCFFARVSTFFLIDTDAVGLTVLADLVKSL